jgi:hypothetical protein
MSFQTGTMILAIDLEDNSGKNRKDEKREQANGRMPWC